MNFRKFLKQARLHFNPATDLARACYYGQEGEDAVLFELIRAGKKQGGFYADVGAHHPVRFSNTFKFYQAGWRGINIEPNPEAMSAFAAHRSEDINLGVAVSEKEEVRKFYCYNEPALNGIDNDRSEELKNTQFRLQKIVDLPTRSLASILSEHGGRIRQPNFLNIDVEGHEMEVLRSNDWSRFSFDFLLIEQRISDLSLLAQTEVWRFLDTLGYKAAACTGRTIIYRNSR